MTELRGIWAAIHTPFRDDLAVDLPGLAGNVRHMAGALRLDGLFCGGIMGEFWSLTLPERRQLAETVIDSAGPAQIAVMATHHSPAETLELGRHAIDSGATFVALMNPFVGPRGEEELYRYFAGLCTALAAPVVLFNTPAFGYQIPPALVGRLAQIAEIRAVKATGSAADTLDARRLCGGLAMVSDPQEAHWLDNLTRHGQQALFADPEPYLFQNAGYRPIADYTAAARSGDLQQAATLAASLAPARALYEDWIIGPLKRGHMPNAALKCWAQALGMAGGPVRPPLSPLGGRDSQALTGLVGQLREIRP